ncbi:16S rRNA (cytosine(1402)-N(4))-methyltransferase [Candidatus Curtissbacteria bacterium RBG_16_39_7]|uniref:Ribosomal RNA small subunit methyltransferase H n=1 Tax=Candidatus Curtissbacteria bacterium RBG_16_39_7 TaxID=1797707 RepID=A0A1F5G290_9BACT|nr:MAG: 16S rRNA (cytosine(1402)-N(4))-methyltransferase [Candidatus Curtissbacteria bacterium RBG_16_39_7]
MVSKFHTPVLLKETIEFLKVKKGKKYIDATLGGGGHTEKIIEAGGKVLGIDCDLDAIEFCSKKFGLELRREEGAVFAQDKRLTLIWQNFSNLKKIATQFDFINAAGIVFDLGASSYQLEEGERGFSFNKSGPLDMRMDRRLKVKAADLINSLSRRQLEDLFKKFGQEKHYRAIARAMVDSRMTKRIQTTDELANLIESVVTRSKNLHPATRVFMALRIVVNSELENLKQALPQAVDLLSTGGRIAVISFQSLEDKTVKLFFKEQRFLSRLTKKPLVPSETEVRENPRSRSAKLRIAEKIH